MNNLIKSYPVTTSISISTVILFICSSLRHWLYKSTAWDLGFFDQALYLISTGQAPIVSFNGFHILGDHASIIFYPLALFYFIYPNVHWLFGIQAIALTIGGFPLYYLSLNAGLSRQQATTIVFTYLLYPLAFNINLFDFHPDVIAVPGFLIAVLAAKTNKIFLFCAAIITILSCKAVLSLTVIAMGLWLTLFESKRIPGTIALFLGVAWFVFSTQFIIPTFTGGEAASVASKYGYLGSSVFEVIKNVFVKPNLVINRIFSLDTFQYLIVIIIPIAWGLSVKHLLPLLSTIPMLLMNILSTSSFQRELTYQYSLPILPFVFISVIYAISDNENWLKTRRNILIWSMASFIFLGKTGRFHSDYLLSLNTHRATTIAISKIRDTDTVLTTAEIAPHLTHRSAIKLTSRDSESINLAEFKYILLDRKHPSHDSSIELSNKLKVRAENSGLFKLEYQQDDVFLFIRKQ